MAPGSTLCEGKAGSVHTSAVDGSTPHASRRSSEGPNCSDADAQNTTQGSSPRALREASGRAWKRERKAAEGPEPELEKEAEVTEEVEEEEEEEAASAGSNKSCATTSLPRRMRSSYEKQGCAS